MALRKGAVSKRCRSTMGRDTHTSIRKNREEALSKRMSSGEKEKPRAGGPNASKGKKKKLSS